MTEREAAIYKHHFLATDMVDSIKAALESNDEMVPGTLLGAWDDNDFIRTRLKEALIMAEGLQCGFAKLRTDNIK